jgi:hypothetical protein
LLLPVGGRYRRQKADCGLGLGRRSCRPSVHPPVGPRHTHRSPDRTTRPSTGRTATGPPPQPVATRPQRPSRPYCARFSAQPAAVPQYTGVNRSPYGRLSYGLSPAHQQSWPATSAVAAAGRRHRSSRARPGTMGEETSRFRTKTPAGVLRRPSPVGLGQARLSS